MLDAFFCSAFYKPNSDRQQFHVIYFFGFVNKLTSIIQFTRFMRLEFDQMNTLCVSASKKVSSAGFNVRGHRTPLTDK